MPETPFFVVIWIITDLTKCCKTKIITFFFYLDDILYLAVCTNHINLVFIAKCVGDISKNKEK